jgi:hypothetical protein
MQEVLCSVTQSVDSVGLTKARHMLICIYKTDHCICIYRYYMYARELEAAAPTVFMVWRRAKCGLLNHKLNLLGLFI